MTRFNECSLRRGEEIRNVARSDAHRVIAVRGQLRACGHRKRASRDSGRHRWAAAMRTTQQTVIALIASEEEVAGAGARISDLRHRLPKVSATAKATVATPWPVSPAPHLYISKKKFTAAAELNCEAARCGRLCYAAERRQGRPESLAGAKSCARGRLQNLPGQLVRKLLQRDAQLLDDGALNGDLLGELREHRHQLRRDVSAGVATRAPGVQERIVDWGPVQLLAIGELRVLHELRVLQILIRAEWILRCAERVRRLAG